MKNRYILMGFLLFLLSMGAHAVGSPMKEDFTKLIALSNKAIEVSKTGDNQAFIDTVNVVRKALRIGSKITSRTQIFA